MTVKRGDIQKILDRDSLKKELDKMLEVNPDTVVVCYYDSESGQSYNYWYGALPTAIGLSSMALRDIVGYDKDEEST